jgi:hypothetical protein
VLVDKDSAKIEANWYPYTAEKYRLFSNLTVHQFSDGLLSFVRFALAGMKLERYAQKARRELQPKSRPAARDAEVEQQPRQGSA